MLNIAIEFDEYVAEGTGNVVLTPSGGNQENTAVLIPVNDTTQVQRRAPIPVLSRSQTETLIALTLQP